jgi:hypothetical protein
VSTQNIRKEHIMAKKVIALFNVKPVRAPHIVTRVTQAKSKGYKRSIVKKAKFLEGMVGVPCIADQ